MSHKLTIKQASNMLGISTKTLRRWEESGYFVPDERTQHTNIRLYNPQRIEYWKKMLELDRSLRGHLKLLQGLRDALDIHNAEQNYIPGQKLKFLDMDKFSKAYDEMEEWDKKYKTLLDELLKFPQDMIKATTEVYDEDKI